MASNRREFLRSMGALGAAAGLGFMPKYVFGDGESEKPRGTLVCIYLRGGCDALNVLIPHYDDLYYQWRPSIAIARKDQGTEPGVVKLNKLFGLHPSLEPLYRHYEAGTFAPIMSVGSPHPSRSHFDCQDFMEYAAPGERGVKDGWLNRYLRVSRKEGESDFRAVATQSLLPRSLRGDYPVLAVPRLRGGANGDPLDVFDDVYQDLEMGMGTREDQESDDIVVQSGRNTIDAIRRYREITSGPESTVVYPQHGFARGLRDIAKTIKAGAGLEVACIDYGGWDHHVLEGGFEGQMADKLSILANSLDAFAKDLGNRFENTLVLTMSEFGRTVKENGNNGTDHGHGGMMLALGGMVQGGQIYGSWGGLEENNLYEGRDLPVITDFRVVMHEVLTKVMNVELPRDFFPVYRLPKDETLDFLKHVG